MHRTILLLALSVGLSAGTSHAGEPNPVTITKLESAGITATDSWCNLGDGKYAYRLHDDFYWRHQQHGWHWFKESTQEWIPGSAAKKRMAESKKPETDLQETQFIRVEGQIWMRFNNEWYWKNPVTQEWISDKLDMKQELEKTLAKVTELEAQLAASEDGKAKLVAELNQRDMQIEVLKAARTKDLEEYKQNLAALTKKIEEAHAEIERTKVKLSAAEKAKLDREKEIVAALKAFAKVQAKADEEFELLVSDVDTLRGEVTLVITEFGKLKGMVKLALDEKAKRDAIVDGRLVKMDELVTKLKKESKELRDETRNLNGQLAWANRRVAHETRRASLGLFSIIWVDIFEGGRVR